MYPEDNDDDTETSRRRNHYQNHRSQTTYDFGASYDNPFEDRHHRYSVPDDPDDNSKLRWRLKTNKSSDTFEKLMTDIEAKMLEKLKQEQLLAEKKRRREVAEKLKSTTAAPTNNNDTALLAPPPAGTGPASSGEHEKKHLHFEELDDEAEAADDDAPPVERLDYYHPLRVKARRAWALVKRSIREKAIAKHNRSNMQWSMLNHTIKNISNKNAGRQTLYDKYLNPKKPRMWAEGIKSIPTDFFSRNAKKIQQRIEETKEKKKPSVTKAQLKELDRTRASMVEHSAKIRLLTPKS